MRIRTGILLAAVGLLTIPFAAQAANKTYAQSGECKAGSKKSTWWSVTVVGDNGMPISTHGISCNGTYYSFYYHTIMVVPSDPFGGVPPNITGTDSMGRDFAVLALYDDNGAIISCVGRNSDGLYWSAAIN